MRQLLYGLLLLGTLVFALAAYPSKENLRPPISLTGTVYSAPDSSRALSSALVGLYKEGRYLALKTTNSKGQFKFENLPTATYQIKISFQGCKETSIDVSFSERTKHLWIGLEFLNAMNDVAVEDVEELSAEVKMIACEARASAEAPRERSVGLADAIEKSPIRSIGSVAATTAGISSADDGEAVHSVGTRKSAAVPPPPAEIEEPEDSPIEDDETPLERESAGQLTAGVISDHNDWETWIENVYEPMKNHSEHWQLLPTQRYVVQVVNHKRVPLPSCVVQLQDAKGTVLWQTRTDNTGRAELWYQLHQKTEKPVKGLYATVLHDGFSQKVKPLKPYLKGINRTEIRTDCKTFSKVNIAWVVDATGSMSDELRYLQSELADVIDRVQNSQPDLTLEQAAVLYRDKGDAYVTRQKEFTNDMYELQKFINEQNANGGGDFPEAVEEALEVALEQLEWDKNALTRLLFLVLDAPPHHNSKRLKRLHQLVRMAAQKGIRVIPIASSGIDKSTEYFLRALALSTNGHYTFLTNHSGIGGAHIEPTASVYQVEKLNDLLVRLIEQAIVTPFCAGTVPEALFAEKETPEASLEALKLFPNPAYKTVKVTIPEGVSQLLITDANGRLLDQWDNLTAGDRQWDVHNYAVGVYFLHYVQGGAQKTERLVVGRR